MCDVLIATGEVEHRTIDIDLPGHPPFEFWRFYTTASNANGTMGMRWKHSWERYASVYPDSIDVYDGFREKRRYSIDSKDPSILVDTGRVLIAFKDGAHFEFRQSPRDVNVWPLVRHEDSHGLWVELHYSDGTLRTIVDAQGRVADFFYNGPYLNYVNIKTGGSALQATYTHDAMGRLTMAADSCGRREFFDYDGEFLISHREKKGAQRYFAYDQHHRCILNWYEGGKRVRRLRWSANGQRVILTDSFGIADVYRLDDSKLVALTDPLNRRTEWIYDTQGALLCRTMPDRRPYLLSSWDSAGNVLTSVDLRGAQTKYQFDHGKIARITNATGATLDFVRNQSGDIVALRDPDKVEWRFEYDQRGSLTRVIDPLEYWIGREDKNGRIRVYDKDGEIAKYDYDDTGNLCRILEADCGEITCTYSVQDQPVALRNPDGGVFEWKYDANGRIAEACDPLNRTTRYSYSPFGSTSTIEYPDGTRVAYALDAEERLTSIVNSKGETTEIEHDIANRVSAIRFFDGRVDRFRYDALNRVIEISDTSTPKLHVTYDETINPVAFDFPGGIREENTFDELNRLTSMRRIGPDKNSDRNAVLTLKYNSNNLVIEENDGRGPVEYRHDPRGRLVGIEDEQSFATNFERDGRGRAVAMVDPSGTYRFHYGAGNQLLKITLPNGAEQAFEYDELLRQTARHLIDQKGNVRCSRQYRYDVAGQLIWIRDWRLGVRTYTYDVRGRLTAVLDQAGRILEEYVYDSEGNILRGPGRANVVVGAGNRVLSADSDTYEYDGDGRMTSMRIGSRQWKFSYGPYSMLQTAESEPEGLIEYYYDLMGRRTEKRSRQDRLRSRHHGNRLVRMSSEVGGICDFTYVPDTLVPLAQRGGNQETVFYTFDQIGTPTELWDQSCSLIAVVGATAYGSSRTVETGSRDPMVVPFHFPGQIVDDETGLHYNRFRYYWPIHARYMTHDPIGLKISLNLYSYVRNPLTWVDPFGLNPIMINCGYANGTPFDACGQYAARHKLDQINAASKARRKKTCSSCRENEQADYFKKTCGGNPTSGNDVDHSLELQLGGADNCCANLVAIPHSVNRSFGSQIKNLIADLPEGAQVPPFAFNPPGCDQADSCTDKAKAVERGTKSDGKDCSKEPALDC